MKTEGQMLPLPLPVPRGRFPTRDTYLDVTRGKGGERTEWTGKTVS